MQHHRSLSTIEQFIAKLRQQVQLEVQHNWRDITLLNIVNVEHNLARVNLGECQTASVNDQGYLVISQGRQVKWLAQKMVIPTTLQEYPIANLTLRLVLTWWAEDARIFINGEMVQQGDLFDSSARVVITDNAQPGTEYLITICLISPYHDIGALMRSHLLYEKTSLPDNPDHIDPGLVADELTVLSRYLDKLDQSQLEVLAEELNKFNWHNLRNADRFADDLGQLRSNLLPLAKDIKHRCFNLLGHAHLDMAWLWTTNETKEVAQRTFKSVLSLQQHFPALTFGHTSPALYEWIERDNPELFQDIHNAVRSNKWELLGGMWIEPETNLVSGESLIRQLIYGQQYYQEKFGSISKVAWLPDSFGFTWQLPQIFKQCGVEYFVTGKLHWNDTTEFPHGCFWWQSPDGTRLLTLMSPPNVTGVMDTNPLTMTDYALNWETQTGLQEIFWLPGVGDHGGGPTRDMLDVAGKWNESPFFPEIKFTKAINYLDKISAISPSSDRFPVWQDELYLELHRGCYTVHADQKKYNRYCERLLYEAELWSSWATLLCEDGFADHTLFSNINIFSRKEGVCQANWQELIEIAWKKVLFNQFHDILPGTSIPEVFTEANRDWEAAIEIGEGLLQAALNAIASCIELPQPPQADAKPIIVFNSLNWSRSQEVTIEDEILKNNDLDFWITEEWLSGDDWVQHPRYFPIKIHNNKLTFSASVLGLGYQLYWLCWTKKEEIELPPFLSNIKTYKLEEFYLTNLYLKVIINPKTGNIDSIVDNINKREILSAPGNKLQFFEDKGQYWDAWNIDPEYEQKRLSDAELQSIEWIDAGLNQGIRVVKKFNKSTFTQDYILERYSNVLKIVNRVDWQETHVMVKAAFPLTISSNTASYEIPCGTISRTTQPQTEAERAKWEVSALNWADITDSEQDYGVSLLNDCKYGYDAKPNQLRLTLLRASTWPDPQSDRGIHHFTYAIYPHKSDWKVAKTVQKGYELNTPLKAIILQSNNNDSSNNKLPHHSQLLKISSDNLILMALKTTGDRQLIMRCYEAHGQPAVLNLVSDRNLQLEYLTDCLENTYQKQEEIMPEISPYRITTVKITIAK